MRLFLLLLIAFSGAVQGATQWQQLIPGIQYTTLYFAKARRQGTLHAFKIDLNRYKLELSSAKDLNKPFAHVQSLAMQKDALIGINGGFFTPQLQPLGLRISGGKVLNRLKRTPWWGVFEIRDNNPKVSSMMQFTFSDRINFAIQSGPRLIVQGQIPMLKGGEDNRSALGITANKELIIVATQSLQMTTRELAEAMRAAAKDDGLDCTDALNLDGGSSTQLFADIGSFYLNVPSFAPIADAVVVVPVD